LDFLLQLIITVVLYNLLLLLWYCASCVLILVITPRSNPIGIDKCQNLFTNAFYWTFAASTAADELLKHSCTLLVPCKWDSLWFFSLVVGQQEHGWREELSTAEWGDHVIPLKAVGCYAPSWHDLEIVKSIFFCVAVWFWKFIQADALDFSNTLW